MKRVFLVASSLLLLSFSLLHAQGVQTGVITGTVQSPDGLSLPGTTVTATSPALQGERTAVTDVNGVYFIKGLPAGSYTVSFDIAAFQSARRENVLLIVGGTAEVNTTMALAARAETITVIGESPSPLATVTTSQAYPKTEIDVLPVGRRPQDIAELAPGLTNNTPNANQVTISGGFAYDNITMLNGVDIDDNLFATPHNLYIEDAIQETNVLTGGISAEYGRFSGGVINVITKSGGNNFSGSFRENFGKPTWIEATPREKANNITHSDVLSTTSEGTFGGPIVRDALWFFSAGRLEDTNTPNTFVQTGGSYTTNTNNKRGELKFTGTVAPGQTVQGSYINNSTTIADTSGLATTLLLDPTVLITRNTPNHLFAANYNGLLRNRFFASAQYSQKILSLQNAGGTSTALEDSPFRTRGFTSGVPATLLYAAPFFSALDPEDRNNRQVTGSVAYTASTARFGTHDLKGGVEWYRSTRIGGNSQSSTGYVFQTDYVVSGGRPVLDAEGVPIPNFVPVSSRVQNWIATEGARIDIDTTSLYFQDRWTPMPRLTVDLGTRFEAVRSQATGDLITVDTNTIVPRLGASFDIEGNGRSVLQASYAHYAGKYSERQFGRNTAVGSPSNVTYGYTGPAGQGRDFAPGLDLRNYATIISASFPTANISMADGLSSQVAREFTVGLGRELGQNGYIKATYLWRNWYNFIDDFIDLSNGTVTVPNVGPLTRVIIDNTSDPTRAYQAILLQNSYRFRTNLTIGAHYTLQIENNGNFEGEAANQPGNVTIYADYPEIFAPALDRYFPEGRLFDFQRHKLRVYATYAQSLGRFGTIDIAPLWRINSGVAYSLFTDNVPLTAIELARNPGYPTNDINASTARRLYYGELGRDEFTGYGALDLSVTYGIPVWRSLRPWIKVEYYNLLGNDLLIQWDRTVTPDQNSPRDANGLPTGFIQGANFGKATQDNHFIQPWPGQNGIGAFRMAIGVRF
jgi:hypothetical protein